MNLLLLLFSNERLAAALPHINLFCVIAAGKLGFVMPLIVAAIGQSHTTKGQKTALSVVSCLAASAIICVANGQLTSLNWAASLLVMLFISWTLYARLYKPSDKFAKFAKATDVASIMAFVMALFGDKATGALEAVTQQADAVQGDAVQNDTPQTTKPNETDDLPTAP